MVTEGYLYHGLHKNSMVKFKFLISYKDINIKHYFLVSSDIFVTENCAQNWQLQENGF